MSKSETAVARTARAIRETDKWNTARIAQGVAFIKRARKSDAKRKAEKQARKRQRGR